MKYIKLSFLLLLFCSAVKAQKITDSIQKLDEVVLSDIKLKRYAHGYKLTILNDSILRKNRTSLTDVLRFNSNIYFKENGYGMVSSPSFRGTNASQTAVIWNGININSQLNGQVDFNTISSSNYNSISIRSGGGSVQYGSGAVGGTIHLSNDFNFEDHFDHRLRIGYGSFNSKNTSYNTSFGNEKWSGNLGLAYTDSDNDYRFLGTDRRNENGAFNNLDINLNLGYIISTKDVIKLYHQNFKSDRELSGTLNTISNSRYEDSNFRTMLEWTRQNRIFNSKVKIAHLQEHFKYFGNNNSDDFTFGKVNTFITNYTVDLRLSNKIKLNAIIDYLYFKGQGSSFDSPNRQAFSTTAIIGYKPNEKLNYGFNVRQEFTSGFNSPLVYALDLAYNISKSYKLTFNASKNFRIPTFNDLYWQPGGNLNLNPETSYQLDLGQDISIKHFLLQFNTFYIRSNDLIQWRPNISGFWSPKNITKTQNYGLEASAVFERFINSNYLKIGINYAYTISENIETKKQLIYVPFHTANFNLAYEYRRASIHYQHIYNGGVFTTSDNLHGSLYSLDAFNVANIGCDYKVIEKDSHHVNIGFRLNNLFNQIYQNVAFRPMPNRNFNIQLNYKF